MQSFALRFSVLAALASSLMACSGSSGDTGKTDTATDKSTCSPDNEIPCYEGLAEPCQNFDSGWEGDEYCLAPPDPALGFQLHVGPTDYDDATQIAQYVMHPGDETNWAEIKTNENATTVFTRGYHSHMRPGSHHFIMYGLNQPQQTGIVAGGSGQESAVGALNGVFLGGATKQIENIDTQGPAPEDHGIGSEVPAGQQIAVNMHFINTTDHDLLQEIWVNFILIPESEVTQFVKPITWYGGVGMSIPPGTHTTLTNTPGSCTAPADVRVGMMIGHVHANTLRVATYDTPVGATDRTTMFEDFDWHDPTEWRFTSSITNPVPDVTNQISGGASGIINTQPGDDFIWECEIQNNRDVTLTFSNKVYDGEMCNVFGYYFTPDRNASPWMCAFF
jgi:hypothetical protein